MCKEEINQTPRKPRLFSVGARSLTAYTIAKLCGANRSTFANKLNSQGYTVKQAVNTCGQISYEQLLERLA